MFNEESSQFDTETFKKMYQELRQQEREDEQRKVMEEAKKREEEEYMRQQTAKEEEKKKASEKVKSYSDKYINQPREIKDNLMQYSDSTGLSRADIMEFAEKLSTSAGKDLKEVSKFLVENRTNSDLDIKVGDNYDEILNRFKNTMENIYNTQTPQQDVKQNAPQEPSYDTSAAPRFNNPVRPVNLGQDISMKLEQISTDYERDFYNNPEKAIIKRSVQLSQAKRKLEETLHMQAQEMDFERRKMALERERRRRGM